MPQISKKTRNFLSEASEESVGPVYLQPTPPSADRMTPGDILVFRYYLGTGVGSREQRVALIVRTRRGDGVFPGKSGKLVSCFRLDNSSTTVIGTIVYT